MIYETIKSVVQTCGQRIFSSYKRRFSIRTGYGSKKFNSHLVWGFFGTISALFLFSILFWRQFKFLHKMLGEGAGVFKAQHTRNIQDTQVSVFRQKVFG